MTGTTVTAEQGPPPARKRSLRKVVNRGLWYAAAVVLATFIAFPLILIFISAISTEEAIREYPRSLIPSGVTLDNITFFLGAGGVSDAFLRSIFVGIVTVVLALAIGAPAGYAIARYAFRGRSGYRLVVLATRAFPIVILSIPMALTFRFIGIADTPWAVAIMHTALALPFTVLITSSVFVSIPTDLEEAAQTLGCSPWQAFVRIALPLSLPGLTAAAIFTWVLSWNDVFAAAILTLRQPTLPAHILTGLAASPPAYQFAAGFILIVPSLIVIFVIRKYLLGLWGRVVK